MTHVVSGKYLDKRKIELKHLASGTTMISDVENNYGGDGSSFNGTELIVAALGACTMTVMLMIAERLQISLQGTTFDIEKEMLDDPRRIGAINLTFHFPDTVPADARPKLEHAVSICPVHNSLHSNIKMTASFNYDLK